MSDDITSLSASGLARRIRDRELSPTAVVDAFLERIARRNDRTNAFVTVIEDRAREEAQRAAEDIDRGNPLGPLHGVPVGIKDLDDVAGVRSTSGSLLYEDRIAEESEVYVERLQAAGAIVLGKTNTPEFGLGTATENRVAGRTSTPFDLDHISGGSSGGAGAALADHLVPLASGSDIGGSIRTPASCCGVFGLKPTFGRIPKTPRPDAFADSSPFSHYGPMARTVDDAARMMAVMAGPHPADPFGLPDDGIDYIGATDRPIDDMAIAYSPTLGIYPIDSTVRAVLDDAVGAFEQAGATVEPVDPPFDVEPADVLEAYYRLVSVRWEVLFDSLEEEGFDPRGADRDKLSPQLQEHVLDADPVSTADYKAASIVRSKVSDAITAVFDEYDLLVSATLAIPPIRHGEYPTEIEGVEIEPHRGWVLTQPYNFSGHPAASVPAGFVEGLPIGMQVAGRRYRDDDVLRASAAFERQRPWHDAYPE